MNKTDAIVKIQSAIRNKRATDTFVSQYANKIIQDKQKKNTAASILQSKLLRANIQPKFNKYLEGARVNYDENTLKEMSQPFRHDELKAAWTDESKKLTIYNLPINKLKKYQLYHELLGINYDFSRLEKKIPKNTIPKVPGKRGRPRKASADIPKVPGKRGRPRKNPV